MIHRDLPERGLFPLLHVCLFFHTLVCFPLFFVCFKWASANMHTATETHTHSQTETNSTCCPWRGLAAPCLPRASWYLWVFWMSGAGTRVILSWKHIWSPRSSFCPLTIHPVALLPLRQPPAQLNPQPVAIQSSELWMCEVKTKDEKYTLRLLRCSLQSAKQVYVDMVNCRPAFGMASSIRGCSCARVPSPVWLRGVCSRRDEQADFHCASGDSSTLPVSVCVYTGRRDNNRIRWITAIQPSYTGGHHGGSGEKTLSLLTLISPGKMSKNTIFSLQL